VKLDSAIISIEQRSIGGCIDLAIAFVREHFVPVFRLVAWFAVPSVALTWWLITRQDWTLAGCLVLFAFECPVLGAALVGAAGHRVFGDPFSTRTGVRLLAGRMLLILPLLIVFRAVTLVAAFLLIFPAYMVATRYGFLAEALLLEECPARRYETRMNDLTGENFIGLVGRLIALVLFFSVAVTSLFMLIDIACGTLFGLPILSGRISDTAYVAEEITTLLTYDPRVAMVLVATLWLVYPVTRLAWMFCYLDRRIQREGWDVELDFRVEAGRLEAAT